MQRFNFNDEGARLTTETAEKITFPWETPPAEGEAIEVAKGILWIRLPLPMALDHVNVYALDDGDSWTIIDTGYHSKRTIAIWENLMQGVLGGKPIGRVLMTHQHPDHVGNVGWFQKHHGASVVSTRTAWLYTRMMVLDVQTEWPPELANFYHKAGMDSEHFEARKAKGPFNYSDVVYPMPLGFTRIVQGDLITIGGREWRVEIGNGHAPEHATLWCDAENLILAGDQILPGISSNVGVYATEPNADPLAEWLESCERFLPMAKPEHLVLPGHKLPFRGLRPRLKQLVENHHSGLARLDAFLAEPHTAVECFPLLFKRKIDVSTYGLALGEAIAHLNHLWLAGKVSRIENDKGVWTWQKL